MMGVPCARTPVTIMIQPGQPLPDATLYEYFEVEKDGCALGY